MFNFITENSGSETKLCSGLLVTKNTHGNVSRTLMVSETRRAGESQDAAHSQCVALSVCKTIPVHDRPRRYTGLAFTMCAKPNLTQ